MAVENGKIDRDQISFTTTQPARDGTQRKFNWTGKVSGDELKLIRVAEGKKRGMEITAKRQ